MLIDLDSGAASGGDAQGDVLSSIEDVQGSAYYDVLRGTSGANRIDGFLGEDLIDGRGGDDEITGGWGDDHVIAYGDGATLDGGDGRDLLDYIHASSAIDANLRLGTGDADEIGHVFLDNGDGTTTETERSTFEDLDGSSFGDTLEGDSQANVIRGLAGADTILGGDGDDTIFGGSSGDAIDGGAGRDWANYSDGFGVNVSLSTGLGFGSTAEGDTLTAIENLRGTRAADVLAGNGGSNVFAPGLSRSVGSDSVSGGFGFDTLLLDYSESDWGQGMTGSSGSGFFQRLEIDGFAVLDRVNFDGIEAFEIVGTFRDDDVTTGNSADRVYLGGGDDVADAGSGGDIAAGQEGDDNISWRALSGSGEFQSVYQGPFYLDGGSGTDLLRIDLAGLDEDVTLQAGEGINVNLAMASGAAAVFFEELAHARTGDGRDVISQTGIVANEIRAGGNVDVIRPGRGIDIVSGGQDFGEEASFVQFVSDNIGIYEPVDLSGILLNPGDLLELDYSEATGAIDSSVSREVTAVVLGQDIGALNSSLRFASTRGTYASDDGVDEVDFDGIERVRLTGSDFDDVLRGTWRGSQYVVSYSTGETTIEQTLPLPSPRGSDVIDGGDGDDVIIGLTGSDIVDGGEGDDTLIGSDPDIEDGVPEGSPAEGADPYELDTLTGGNGGDLFVLGVAGPQSFYLGRLEDVEDAADNRAVITDFDATEGDQLQLAGSSSDYRVEVTADATLILLEEGPREIIAELQGVTGLDLTSASVTYVGGSLDPGVIVGGIDLDLLPAVFGGSPVAIPGLSMVSSIARSSAAAFTGGIAAGPGSTLSTIVPPALSLEAAPPAAADDALVLSAEGPWIVQENDPAALLAALFGVGTDPALTGGVLTLEGDGRAFGVFDGDPFGLGSGIALSTGAAAGLDGVNLIDGGLYGPYEPDVEFERVGEFAGSTIFRATLTGLGTGFASLKIVDDGDAIGGLTGRLSGTDLDAIVLSTDRIDEILVGDDLNDPSLLSRLEVFDFNAAGMRLTPGVQRAPVDANLQGTQNGLVDASTATLDAFDYNGTNNSGFVTLGDGGSIGFNLSETVPTNQHLYLYVAEAGANELLAAELVASDTRLDAPADLSTDFGAFGAEGDRTSLTYEFGLGADDAGKLLTFDFALASEELREFAGSAFNDAFRIYLNGVQLATLSDGAAATINALQPAPFAASHPDLVMNAVGSGPVVDDTRADAYTEVLSFAGRTSFGQNTLRIEVEDVRDGLLDSAILVRGGSMSLVDDGGGIVTPNDPDATGEPRVTINAAGIPLTEGEPPTAVPVALTGLLDLTAPVMLTFQPATADLDLGSGAGVAHAVALAPGDPLSFDLAVSAVADGIDEGTEFALVAVEVDSTGPLDDLPVAPLLFEVSDAQTRPFDITLGDAPERFSRLDPTAWSDAWTDPRVALDQKQAPSDPAWLPVDLGTLDPGTYGGSGLSRGDLGVSGRMLASEVLPQEIDGTEALRLTLTSGLSGHRLELTLEGFEADEGGTGVHEAARFRFLDDGAMVAERFADAGAGDTFDFAGLPGFDELIVDAGAPSGGSFAPAALSDGTEGTAALASGFLVDTLVIYGDEIL